MEISSSEIHAVVCEACGKIGGPVGSRCRQCQSVLTDSVKTSFVLCRSCNEVADRTIGGQCEQCYAKEMDRFLANAEPDKETDLAEVLADIVRRLDALEQHFTEQGINDLAHAIEPRIVSRLKYGRNPRIEISERK